MPSSHKTQVTLLESELLAAQATPVLAACGEKTQAHQGYLLRWENRRGNGRFLLHVEAGPSGAASSGSGVPPRVGMQWHRPLEGPTILFMCLETQRLARSVGSDLTVCVPPLEIREPES